jgi:hypothetical protein
MGEQEDEVQRLIRLRDEQLQARDPLKKERKLHHGIARRQRGAMKKFSLATLFEEVGNRWWGLLMGGLLGMILSLMLPLLIDHAWVDALSVVVIAFLAVLGFLTGNAIDSREELEDLIHGRRKR